MPSRSSSWLWLACVLLALLVCVTNLLARESAEAESPWSEPSVVFQTTGAVTHPRLLADSSGDVHLFFVYREARDPGGDTPGSLMYARFHNGTWSHPVEILTSPDGGRLNLPAVTLDPRGYFHVVWQGGALGQIYYSRAHVLQVDSARGWTLPRLLSNTASSNSDILAASDGVLHLAFTLAGENIFYRQSRDGGQSWTPELAISHAEPSNSASDYPRIAVDQSGRLHVAWTQFELPHGWPPSGAFYSQSSDGGKNWTPPLQVAGENFGLINVATTEKGAVHLVWNATVGLGDRKHQWSDNGGQSWSSPQRITEQIKGGFTGYSAMAFDSAGVLHLVTSVSGKGRTEDVYYLAWNGKTWSDPILISSGAVGKESVELPWIVVSEGNRLFVVYEDDFERIWYTTRLTDAPAVPPQPLPTLFPTATKIPTQVSTPPPPTATRARTWTAAESPNQSNSSSPWFPLLLGTIPVLLLIGAIVVTRLARVGQR